MDSNEFSQEKAEAQDRIMTRHSRKIRSVKKPKIGKEFKRIAEKNLRKDRELLERLAKI